MADSPGNLGELYVDVRARLDRLDGDLATARAHVASAAVDMNRAGAFAMQPAGTGMEGGTVFSSTDPGGLLSTIAVGGMARRAGTAISAMERNYEARFKAATFAQQKAALAQVGILGGPAPLGGEEGGGGLLGGLKSMFGRGSVAGLLSKTLIGGGAIYALGILGKAFEGLTTSIAGTVTEIQTGQKSFGEAMADMVGKLPIIGHVTKGWESLMGAVTGQTAALQKADTAFVATGASLDRQEKLKAALRESTMTDRQKAVEKLNAAHKKAIETLAEEGRIDTSGTGLRARMQEERLLNQLRDAEMKRIMGEGKVQYFVQREAGRFSSGSGFFGMPQRMDIGGEGMWALKRIVELLANGTPARVA